jgi:TDG/mug DNA glycosylase family protein
LSEPIRRELKVERLTPEHDSLLPRFGIGLTDLIKRPSANASELTPAEFEQWVPHLVEELLRYQPRVACFHGLTAFRPFLRFALRSDRKASLGPQPEALSWSAERRMNDLRVNPAPCATRLFVVPNPSPANAHFTPRDQAQWYDRLADFINSLERQCD